MRGVGGPLLCMGDLLNDVAADGEGNQKTESMEKVSALISGFDEHVRPEDLQPLFQENYEKLRKALMGNDHSWTALTLELCFAVEGVHKLVQSANSGISPLLDNLTKLENVIKRGDAIIEEAKIIQSSCFGQKYSHGPS